MRVWTKVVYACDCPTCECCGEPVCVACDTHYADCDCPGPTQDGYDYRLRRGVLEAALQDDD